MRDGTIDELSDKNKKTIETLRKVIDKNTSDTDAVLLRKVDFDYLKKVFDIDTEDIDIAVKKLNDEKLGNTVIEKGFLSTSYKVNKNFNNNDKVELEILAPKGTKMYLTMNRDESEIILQAGTNLRFEGATVNDGNIKMQMRVAKFDVDIKGKSGLRIIKANELKTIDSQERKFIKVNEQQDYKPVYVNQNINIQKNRNNVMIEAYKSINSKNDVYISNKVSLKPKELHTIDKGITDTYKLLGNIDKYRKPKIVIIGEEEFASSALASYNAKDNVLYINKLMGNKLKIKELQKGYAASNNPLSTYYHEILHWSDAQKYVEKYGKIDYQSEYVKWIINKSKKDVEKLIKSN